MGWGSPAARPSGACAATQRAREVKGEGRGWHPTPCETEAAPGPHPRAAGGVAAAGVGGTGLGGVSPWQVGAWRPACYNPRPAGCVCVSLSATVCVCVCVAVAMVVCVSLSATVCDRVCVCVCPQALTPRVWVYHLPPPAVLQRHTVSHKSVSPAPQRAEQLEDRQCSV